MFTTIKMIVGCVFAIGIGAYSIYKRKTYGNYGAYMTAGVCALAFVIFLGQAIGE